MFELRVTAGLPMHLRRAAMVGDLWTTFHFWFSVVRAIIGKREIILGGIIVVGEGFFRTGRRSERVADARIWPLDARTVTLG
jgi:hypothetical protein